MSNQYKIDPHHFIPMSKKSKCAYPYCVACGLIYMKNGLSEWAAKQGCNYKEHPSFKTKLGITNPFN